MAGMASRSLLRCMLRSCREPVTIEADWTCLLPSVQCTTAYSHPPTAGQRHFATKPEAAVYGGAVAKSPIRVTLHALQQKYNRGEKLTMMTAYDYPSAVHVRLPCHLLHASVPCSMN